MFSLLYRPSYCCCGLKIIWTKKETERSSTVYDDKREVRTELSEQNSAVDKVLDEIRGNVRRTIGEARKDISCNTQAINDYQEHILQASKEIVNSCLESQKGDY